jgi:hypothetical protein
MGKTTAVPDISQTPSEGEKKEKYEERAEAF